MKIKSLFAAAVIAVSLIGLSLQAQDIRIVAAGGTANLAMSATNTYNIAAKTGTALGLSIYLKTSAATDGIITGVLKPTDATSTGVSTVSGQAVTFVISGASTNSSGGIYCVTNFTVGALPSYQLTLANTNAAVSFTNLTIKTFTK